MLTRTLNSIHDTFNSTADCTYYNDYIQAHHYGAFRRDSAYPYGIAARALSLRGGYFSKVHPSLTKPGQRAYQRIQCVMLSGIATNHNKTTIEQEIRQGRQYQADIRAREPCHHHEPRQANRSLLSQQIGRASCRERSVDLG